jgi:hypothetical protein
MDGTSRSVRKWSVWTLTLCLAVALGCSGCGSRDNEMKLALRMSPVSEGGKTVAVRIVLTNISKNTILVPNRSLSWGSPASAIPLEMKLTDYEGFQYPIRVTFDGAPPNDSFVLLAPNAFVSRTLNISEFSWAYNALPGDYILQLMFHSVLPPPDGRKAWEGSIVSNEVKIQIKCLPKEIVRTKTCSQGVDNS